MRGFAGLYVQSTDTYGYNRSMQLVPNVSLQILQSVNDNRIGFFSLPHQFGTMVLGWLGRCAGKCIRAMLVSDLSTPIQVLWGPKHCLRASGSSQAIAMLQLHSEMGPIWSHGKRIEFFFSQRPCIETSLVVYISGTEWGRLGHTNLRHQAAGFSSKILGRSPGGDWYYVVCFQIIATIQWNLWLQNGFLSDLLGFVKW